MPAKIYVLKLTREERGELKGVVKSGKAAGWKIQRAQALLKCDQGANGPGWIDDRIAEAFGCTRRSVENWRKQAMERGPLSLLERKPRSDVGRTKLDGEGEARLVQLACSQAPAGYARWSLRLLANKLVALEVVNSISHESVRGVMKKTRSSLG
jgi:transposase-like protein